MSKQKKQMKEILDDVLLDDLSETKLIESEFEDDIEKNQSKIRNEFEVRFKNLEIDIEHIDSRLSHIQKFVINMETQVDNIKNLIKLEKHPGKKGNYFGLMNTAIEINAKYEDLYLKCLDIKYKYRKEQNDLNVRISRMAEIELPKAGINTSEDILSPGKLAKMISDLTTAISKNDTAANDLTDSLLAVNENPEYNLE